MSGLRIFENDEAGMEIKEDAERPGWHSHAERGNEC
jgi:hypothetical protein